MRLYVVCLSVCPSVTFRYHDHIGWNSSKIISRPNSLRPIRSLMPKMGDLVQRGHPLIRVEKGWGQEHIKPVISPKRCKIGQRLLLRANRKSHMRFRLAPILLRLDDPWTAEINKNSGAHQKNFNKNRLTLSAAKCRPVSVVSKNIRYTRICIAYYRAMLRKARLWDCMSSVRLCDFHPRWNTSKIIARPNSLGSLLSLTPTGAVCCNGNTPKMGVEYGWGQMKLIKAAIFLAS